MSSFDTQVRASVDLVLVAERAGITHRQAERLIEAIVGLEDFGQCLLQEVAEKVRAEEARAQRRRIRLLAEVLRAQR